MMAPLCSRLTLLLYAKARCFEPNSLASYRYSSLLIDSLAWVLRSLLIMPSSLPWSSVAVAAVCLSAAVFALHALANAKRLKAAGGSSPVTATDLKNLAGAQHGAAAAAARATFGPKPFKVRAERLSATAEHEWYRAAAVYPLVGLLHTRIYNKHISN